MTENSVVRARIDATTKSEAAAVLATMGLSVSDAFRMLLKRVAADKKLPGSIYLTSQTSNIARTPK